MFSAAQPLASDIEPPIASAAASIIVDAREVADLAHLFAPATAAVVLRRTLAPSVIAAAHEVLAAPLAVHRLVVDPADADLGGLPSALADDLGAWITVVADLCDAPRVGVRIVRADTAMCPRFHVDRVALRVAITYVGPGTELVPDSALDRSKLSPHHGGLADADSGLLRDPSAIVRACAGDIVVMTGELWSPTSTGTVHRSPATTIPRLLVTLDPLG